MVDLVRNDERQRQARRAAPAYWALVPLLLLLACSQPGPPKTRPGSTKTPRAKTEATPKSTKAPSPTRPTKAKTPATATETAPGRASTQSASRTGRPAKEEGQGEVPQKVRVNPPLTSQPRLALRERLIRVGLATDLESLWLPCCDPTVRLRIGSLDLPLSTAIQVEPAGELNDLETFRLQVAALKDEGQARGIAERLGRATGKPADAVFDAGTDLYRVRVGRFPDRRAAEAARGELEALGIVDAWIASEGGLLAKAALRIRQGKEVHTVPGRWLAVEGPRDKGINLGKRGRFRGRVLVHVNRRGRLNLINELPIEDYLRGVVPMEMGPELYNQLEALKAQTVAARTYTVRNLSEFADEGYDICSSPRCQVYGGMRVEHPFSDRAVRETHGQVALFDGQPAETFYSATCGGHTENVEVVFPLKQGPYLRGVPCLESGESTLAGSLRPGSPFPAGLTHLLLPTGEVKPELALTDRLRDLAALAEMPVPKDRLRSLKPAELRRFLASLFDLALDPRLLSPRTKLARLLQSPPRDWRDRDLALAAYLLESEIAGGTKTAIPATEVERLLLRLALYFGVLEERDTHFLALSKGQLNVRSDSTHLSFPLPSRLATFRGPTGALQARPLGLMAGDRLRLYLHAGEPIAAVQNYLPANVILGKRRPRGPWRHFRSQSDVRRAVQTRYPGFPFRDFEVLLRGVSGRVGRLLLRGEGDRNLLVEGLPVRWTLDLPDTRFTAQPHRPQNGEAGWIFSGSGWGHGVGMCQTGTFGMAMRGAAYNEILHHYYTGIELGRLREEKPGKG